MRVADSDITVEFGDQGRITASWVGISGYTSWIYVNGVQFLVQTFPGTARQITTTVDFTKPVRVEVHELSTTQIQQHPCEPENSDPPVIYWEPVSQAARYSIHGRHEGPYASQTLKFVEKRIGEVYYQERVENDILRDGGCYWWFKVNSISQYNVPSSSSEWPYFEMGLPPLPTGATLARDGATLKLTLQV